MSGWTAWPRSALESAVSAPAARDWKVCALMHIKHRGIPRTDDVIGHETSALACRHFRK